MIERKIDDVFEVDGERFRVEETIGCINCNFSNIECPTVFRLENFGVCSKLNRLDVKSVAFVKIEKQEEKKEMMIDHNKGIKNDQGKLRWDLVDTLIKIEVDALRDYVVPLPNSTDDLRILIECGSWSFIVASLIERGLCTWEQIVDIYTKGAEKYGEYNWQKVENPKARYYSALIRHDKEGNNDADWGHPHYAHMAWNAIALRWFEKNGGR